MLHRPEDGREVLRSGQEPVGDDGAVRGGLRVGRRRAEVLSRAVGEGELPGREDGGALPSVADAHDPEVSWGDDGLSLHVAQPSLLPLAVGRAQEGAVVALILRRSEVAGEADGVSRLHVRDVGRRIVCRGRVVVPEICERPREVVDAALPVPGAVAAQHVGAVGHVGHDCRREREPRLAGVVRPLLPELVAAPYVDFAVGPVDSREPLLRREYCRGREEGVESRDETRLVGGRVGHGEVRGRRGGAAFAYGEHARVLRAVEGVAREPVFDALAPLLRGAVLPHYEYFPSEASAHRAYGLVGGGGERRRVEGFRRYELRLSGREVAYDRVTPHGVLREYVPCHMCSDLAVYPLEVPFAVPRRDVAPAALGGGVDVLLPDGRRPAVPVVALAGGRVVLPPVVRHDGLLRGARAEEYRRLPAQEREGAIIVGVRNLC